MLQQYLPFTVLKRHGATNYRNFHVTSCNSTYRLRYWNRNNFCSKTCIVYRVATVLTVYGIETRNSYLLSWVNGVRLQQYLPFTVLKHSISIPNALKVFICCNSTYRLRYWNIRRRAFGIDWSAIMLQQYLPFTVLKLYSLSVQLFLLVWLQQYLPFTVLKLYNLHRQCLRHFSGVATVLTVYGIETCNGWDPITAGVLQQYLPFTVLKLNDIGRYTRSKCSRCNSTYRLRYWNLKPLNFADLPSVSSLQQYLPFTVLKLQCNWCYWRIWCCIVATVLTVYGIETDNAA